MTDSEHNPLAGLYLTLIGLLITGIVLYIGFASYLVSDVPLFPEYRKDEVSAIIAPVGRVRVAGQEAPEESGMDTQPAPVETASAEQARSTVVDTGKRVYNSLCFSCHSTGLPKVPQLGKADEWAPRLGTGIELLYQHALEGYTGESGIPMPARGGNPALTDEEVKAAVDYLTGNSR